MILQSIDLMRSIQPLSINAKRLFLFLIYEKQGAVSVAKFKSFINSRSDKTYINVRIAIKELMTTPIFIFESGALIKTPILKSVNYAASRRIQDFEFCEALKPHVEVNHYLDFYSLPKEAAWLKRTRSIRLLEIMMTCEGPASFDIDILKKVMNANNKDFNQVKAKLVDPALKEINNLTNLNLTAKYIKQGRTTKEVIFY